MGVFESASMAWTTRSYDDSSVDFSNDRLFAMSLLSNFQCSPRTDRKTSTARLSVPSGHGDFPEVIPDRG